MIELTPRFIIGMILLLSNQPLGWGGMLLCMYLAKRTGKKWLYVAGTAVYGLSWGMLALGVYMAGPGGMAFTRALVTKYGIYAYGGGTLIVLAVLIYVWKKKRIKEAARKSPSVASGT